MPAASTFADVAGRGGRASSRLDSRIDRGVRPRTWRGGYRRSGAAVLPIRGCDRHFQFMGLLPFDPEQPRNNITDPLPTGFASSVVFASVRHAEEATDGCIKCHETKSANILPSTVTRK